MFELFFIETFLLSDFDTLPKRIVSLLPTNPRHKSSYSQLMIGVCPITETKRIGHLGSMKPFSDDERGCARVRASLGLFEESITFGHLFLGGKITYSKHLRRSLDSYLEVEQILRIRG